VAAFRRGLELAPDRPAIKQKLATALALNGDIPAALAFYRQLLEQDPGFPEAHYSLGALFLGSGQLDLAIEEFAAAVRADPTYVQAHLQLAHTLRRAGRLQPALAAYEQTLSIDPRMADARLGYAVALTGQGRWGTARAWLNEGRRAHPERLEFLDLLIRLLAASPDPNVRDGRLALELGQDLVARSRSWRTLESTAMALAETGRYDEAVTRQREAMEVYRREAGAPNEAMAGNLLRYERREPCRVPWAGDPIP
jgi:tetratricopeptide (TPR) repeat protein